MEQWVIYDNPSDFPGQIVVRRWLIGPGTVEPTPHVSLCTTIDQARNVVQANYPSGYRLPRQQDDDPCIVEVWI